MSAARISGEHGFGRIKVLWKMLENKVCINQQPDQISQQCPNKGNNFYVMAPLGHCPNQLTHPPSSLLLNLLFVYYIPGCNEGSPISCCTLLVHGRFLDKCSPVHQQVNKIINTAFYKNLTFPGGTLLASIMRWSPRHYSTIFLCRISLNIGG